MERVLATLALALLVVAAWPTPASANGGPHQGSYALVTSVCSSCHRAQTSSGSYPLNADTVYALCVSCHGGLVATDVVHGVVQGATNIDGVTPRKLNGGGFVQQNGAPVTSRHRVKGVPVGGTPFAGTVVAYGSQNGDGVPASDAGLGVSGVLECTSCHNPHGSTNYRILRDASTTTRWVAGDPDLLDFVSYQVRATRDDSPNYGFDFTNMSNCPPANVTFPPGTATPFGGGYGPGSSCMQRFTSGIVVSYANGINGTPTVGVPDPTKGMNAFCATCHKSYLTLRGSGHVTSLETPAAVGPGTPTTASPYLYPGRQNALDGYGNIARVRHAVEMVRDAEFYPKQPLRFAAIGNNPNPPAVIEYRAMGCLTCHYAHGSSSVLTPVAGTTPVGLTEDNALLFYSNRGVCVACHRTLGPAPSPTP